MAANISGAKEMTIYPQTQFRTFVVLLALTAGVGAALPIGSGAQSQELLWATQAGGPSGGIGAFGIATSARGDSFVTGAFAGMATFGAGEPNETILTAPRSHLFVARYDRDGGLLWATQAGGPSL